MHKKARPMKRLQMNMLFLYNVVLFSSAFLLADELQLIKSIAISKNSLKVFAHDDFKKRYLMEDFFVEYDEDINLSEMDESLAVVPFIANIASIIWISGKTYTMHTLDQDFFDSLVRLKEVFKIFYPKTRWDGELKVTHLVKNRPRKFVKQSSAQMALLFSYGLDSVFSSFQHRDKKQLLITGWGQDDISLDNVDLWLSRKKQMVDFAQKYGHENSFLKSNYADFRNENALLSLTEEIQSWRLGAAEDIAWAGLAAPIMWAKGVESLYIGSSDPDPYPVASNPFINENIAIAGHRFFCDQYGFTRQDKIEHMGVIMEKLGLENFFIKACTSQSSQNCHECDKCIITILAIFAAGLDPRAFGYSDNPERVFQKWRGSSISKLSYLKRFRLQSIRNTVLKSADLALHEKFRWLLEANLEENIENTFAVGQQTKVDYKTLFRLFPSIGIPKKLFDS